VQEHVSPGHEPPHLELVKAPTEICSDTPAFMWGSAGVRMLQIFIAPLLDKSACHGTCHAQEEADEQDDIDANGDTRRMEGLIR